MFDEFDGEEVLFVFAKNGVLGLLLGIEDPGRDVAFVAEHGVGDEAGEVLGGEKEDLEEGRA